MRRLRVVSLVTNLTKWTCKWIYYNNMQQSFESWMQMWWGVFFKRRRHLTMRCSHNQAKINHHQLPSPLEYIIQSAYKFLCITHSTFYRIITWERTHLDFWVLWLCTQLYGELNCWILAHYSNNIHFTYIIFNLAGQTTFFSSWSSSCCPLLSFHLGPPTRSTTPHQLI